MAAIMFDTEVNSLDEMEVIELAYCHVDVADGSIRDGLITTERFKPVNPIEIGAMLVHGIMDQDLSECRPSAEAEIPEAEYIIAHNVDFDADVIGNVDSKRICTLALSRYCFPTFREHTLSAMFLNLMGASRENLDKIRGAHSAETDVEILSDIVRIIVAGRKIKTMQELWVLSEVARIPTVMAFGKHKGESIDTIPRSYITWLLGQEIDQYLRKGLNIGLEGRKK